MSEAPSPSSVTADRPWATQASTVLTVLAAGLLLSGMVIELAAAASAAGFGWPVVWSTAMLFHAVMARRGSQWGRVMLAVQAGLTWLLATLLIVPEPSLLDTAPRPDVVVGLALSGAIVQTAGAAAAFLPPSNSYTRARRDQAWRMSPRLRKAVLTVHICSSMAWMGVIIVQSVLVTLTYAVESPALFRTLYEAMIIVDNLFLAKLSFLALFSGLASALGTPWHLTHHWWVLAKFALTLLAMVLPIVIYQPALDHGYALVLDGHSPAQVNTALGFLGFLPALQLSPLLLLTAAVLSTYKPWGRTRKGHLRTTRRLRTRAGSAVVTGTPGVLTTPPP